MEIRELQQLQALPLEIKILKTKQRIREWVNYWGKDGVYVSFSGGKDSTVLLDLVRSEFPDIVAVFVDTGLEYPEIKEFIKKHKNVEIIKPKLDFLSVLKKYGYPVVSKEVSLAIYEARSAIKNNKTTSYSLKKLNGTLKNKNGEKSFYCKDKYKYLLEAPFKISHHCCNYMKKEPVRRYEKLSGRKPFVGTLAAESFVRLHQYLQHGCNAFDNNHPVSNPLGFWTENDILKYIIDNNIEIASVYGDVIQTDLIGHKFELTGERRTGCMFCMFGVHLEKGENRFQRMKKTHSKIYDYCINNLKIGEILDYIGVKY